MIQLQMIKTVSKEVWDDEGFREQLTEDFKLEAVRELKRHCELDIKATTNEVRANDGNDAWYQADSPSYQLDIVVTFDL